MAELNVRLRTDATPEQLLKELFLSPLIYLRLLGVVSLATCRGQVALNIDHHFNRMQYAGCS